jgi:hypothetical protein
MKETPTKQPTCIVVDEEKKSQKHSNIKLNETNSQQDRPVTCERSNAIHQNYFPAVRAQKLVIIYCNPNSNKKD